MTGVTPLRRARAAGRLRGVRRVVGRFGVALIVAAAVSPVGTAEACTPQEYMSPEELAAGSYDLSPAPWESGPHTHPGNELSGPAEARTRLARTGQHHAGQESGEAGIPLESYGLLVGLLAMALVGAAASSPARRPVAPARSRERLAAAVEAGSHPSAEDGDRLREPASIA